MLNVRLALLTTPKKNLGKIVKLIDIIEANKKEGKADAEKRAIEELERELGKMDDVKVVIDTFYATFDV